MSIDSGPKHRIHRKVMSAPLKWQVLENFIDVFDAKGRECATNIARYLDGDYFDVLEDVEKSTMALVCGKMQEIQNWCSIS